MIVNRIKEKLTEIGIDGLRPTSDQLISMDTTLHTWNKWLAKKSDPQLYQLRSIAQFLGCGIDELILTPIIHENGVTP